MYKRIMTILAMILLGIVSCQQVSALSSGVLGDDLGLVLEISPNVTHITQNITNNYGEGTINPQAPWLWNETINLFFNETLMNQTCDARDDDTTYNCADWNSCDALTTTYNASYHATSLDVTANRTAWFSTYNATYDAKPDTTYNASYHATTEDVTANRTAWETDTDTTYTEDSPYLTLTDTVFSFVESVMNATIQAIVEGYGYITTAFNQTYHDTSLDVTANRTAWFSTYNATYDAKQNDIGDNCAADNYVYGVQDDGTLLCREDTVGGSGEGENYWVDGGDYLYPNTTYGDNVVSYGYINASTWDNVTITESQISDLSHTTDTNCSTDQSCSSIIYDTDESDLNTNASNYWDNLNEPLPEWTDTYNATYDATSKDVTANRTAWETDTDTTYSENDYYLTLTGTVFGLNETRLNATIDERDDIGSSEGGKSASGPYLYNDTDTIYLNETVLNITIDERDDDTTYTEDSPYLTLTDTVFSFVESVMNATIQAIVEGYGYITTAFNQTYHDTSLDVTANRTAWFSTYNATYDAKPDTTYNATYDATSKDVTANRTSWLSTYNATYDAYEDTTIGNCSVTDSCSNIQYGTDDDTPDDDSEVPDDITLNTTKAITITADTKVQFVNSSIYIMYNSTTGNLTICNQCD